MTKTKPGKEGRKAPETREDRLKAALKANLARRKAQMRARKDNSAGQSEDKG